MYFMALWPVGPQMVDDTIEKVFKIRHMNNRKGIASVVIFAQSNPIEKKK
jgi:hypothetical protein